MLGMLLAGVVAKQVGKAVVNNAPKVIAATGAVVGGVAVASAVKSHNEKQRYQQATQRAAVESRARQNAEIEARREAQRAAQLEAQLAAQKEAQKQKERKNELKKQKENENKRINATINECMARFAICYYIAMADGILSPQEKNTLDQICLDTYNKFKYDHVKVTLLEIYNTPNMNLITLERYLKDVEPSSIASFLSLADEIADLDGNTTDAEKESIYKIRRYLTDRTGFDYLGNYLHLNTDVNLVCPNCTSPMKVIPYDNKAQCPYCGYFKYLAPINTKAKPNSKVFVTVKKDEKKCVVDCPECNRKMSFIKSAKKVQCPNCQAIIDVMKS